MGMTNPKSKQTHFVRVTPLQPPTLQVSSREIIRFAHIIGEGTPPLGDVSLQNDMLHELVYMYSPRFVYLFELQMKIKSNIINVAIEMSGAQLAGKAL